MSEVMPVREHLYDAKGQITKAVDFGIDLHMSSQVPVPPRGLRFNLDYQAELTGKKLKGKVVGTNYAHMSGDGVTHLNSYGVLTTPEGDRIAVHATGISVRSKDLQEILQHENISFYTCAERYVWLNQIQAWANGSADPETGKFAVKAYIA